MEKAAVISHMIMMHGTAKKKTANPRSLKLPSNDPVDQL